VIVHPRTNRMEQSISSTPISHSVIQIIENILLGQEANHRVATACHQMCPHND